MECRTGGRQLVEKSARLATGPTNAPPAERQQDLLQDTRLNHQCAMTVSVSAERSGTLLRSFFEEKRR